MEINKSFLGELNPHDFPRMSIQLPTGFNVYEEKHKRYYFKKWGKGAKTPTIFLIYEPPQFFIMLFPEAKKQGITDNYSFIKRSMEANLDNLQNLHDAFFVVMKGIFIPDTGNQNNTKMEQFTVGDRKCFINYNLGPKENYFDCNIADKDDSYYKIYIKDMDKKLDLEKVAAIISTLKPGPKSLDF
ncbi:MAG TPA: hypothetical protein PLL10_10755 [Elusimicrobiales bacterium]|nr:hypothetical protein [Elusimicrobiales bacterium]